MPQPAKHRVQGLDVCIAVNIEMAYGGFEKTENSSLAQSEAGFNW